MYYAVTERMKALYASKQRQTVNISVELKDGSTIDDFVITEADILSDSFSIDRYCATGENLEIGSAVASEIKFGLDNSSGKFDDIQLGGAKLFVRLGINDSNDESSPSELMDCGYYTVDENPKPLAVISVAALDNMMKFDKDVSWDNFAFPMTVEHALEICCDACGVTLSPAVSFSTLTNGSYEISSYPETLNITYRQIVQWIAEITGTCAWVDWNGHLRLSWCENTGIEIAPSMRYSSVVEDAITVTGVQITESEEDKYLYGEEGFIFNIEGNELIQNNRETVAKNLGAVLCGFTYVPIECSCFPIPYLYPLDVVSFVTLKGETFNTVVTAHVYSLNGTSSLKASGENQEQKSYASSSPFTKREATIIKTVQKEQKKQLSKVEKDSLDLNNSLIYALGLYPTKIKHENGSETQYLHSKEKIEDCVAGDVIFCLNSGGFGVCVTGWNNGEPVFENGFDAKNGKAIWQYLSANTITANLIKAGKLTSVDGNTTFDLDEGTIQTKISEVDENGEEDIKYLFVQSPSGIYHKTHPLASNFEDLESVEWTEKEITEIEEYENSLDFPDNPMGNILKAFSILSFKYKLLLKKLMAYCVECADDDFKYSYIFSGNKAVFLKGPKDGYVGAYSTELSAEGIKSRQKIGISGKEIEFGITVGSEGNEKEELYRPYYQAGDSFEVTVRTAGYVTNGSKDVLFVVPLAKPILKNVIVSAATNKGAILRQAGKYTHGCTSNTNTVPDSYTVYKQNVDSICVRCHFTDITNAINNDVIGVQWNGIITFE